jgi:phage baseplate assembly protein W
MTSTDAELAVREVEGFVVGSADARRVDVDVPLRFDDLGHTAAPPSYADHVKDMIKLVLFTNPMERVNRPDFGSGLRQAVHAPASPELAATVEYTTHAALQSWLADVVEVHQLKVEVTENRLEVGLDYTLLRTGDRRTDVFGQAVIR